MKKVVGILLLCFCCELVAQTDYSDRWEDLFAYTNVKDFIAAGDLLYAVTDNAVFLYNRDTEETTKLSSVQGLSGGETSAIHYSSAFNTLVIGYENGLLEIVSEDGEITTAPEITNFNQTGEKRINHIHEYNGKLFIATSFAIVVYDLNALEFGDTYFIGPGSSDENIHRITVFNTTIYAAAETGIYTANINNPNLIDFNSWTKISSGNYKAISVFNDRVYAAKATTLVSVNSNSVATERNFDTDIVGLKSSATSLGIAFSNTAVFLGDNLQEIAQVNSNVKFDFNLNQVYEENSIIFLATKRYGVLKTQTTAPTTFIEIHPQGPLRNDIFAMDVHNNNLWVVYGGYDATYTPLQKREGYSYYNGKDWNNSPFNAQQPFGDLTYVTIDKSKENSVYISSFGDISGPEINTPLTGGLLYLENNEPQQFYNQSNSPLQDIVSDLPNRVTIRVSGTALDSNGNLWVTNIGVASRLKKLSPSGTWTNYDIQSIVNVSDRFGMNEVAIDRRNTVWIGTRRNGVYAYNENGDRKKAFTTEPTKGNLPNLNVRTVAIDRTNRLWMGTLTGLVVYSNPLGIFDTDIFDAAPVIILDDGVPKKLLGDQTINSIEIDGADNKWFGSETGGVLYTNPSGNTTLANFNKDNSPLPSNKIIKIKADEVTGKVYFATNRGMVVYDSKVAPFGDALGEVYAYPNPVLKNHQEVVIRGRNGTNIPKGTNVKIVDVSGQLVYETNVVEGQQLGGGKVTWNKHNLAGVKVASGIYIVLLSSEDNAQTSSTKIAIVN